MKTFAAILGLSLLATLPAAAEEPVTLKYHFTKGKVLRYDGKHAMTVESTVSGTTRKLESQTNSLREWRVISVDEKGNARLALTLVRAQVEATSPDGQRIAFDSEKDGSKGPLSAVVGKPLVEVVLSPSGQVIELGQATTPAAGQFTAYLRTQLIPLPATPVAAGATWQQDLVLPVPGRDDKIRIRQSFRLERVTNSVATINLESALAEEIKDRAIVERIAQFLASGRIELDMTRGVIRNLELTHDQKVTDFAGADSVVRVVGSYRETLKDDVAGTDSKRQ